ncbi:unnamed protein product [Didymodactylos carnosus]|uniref:SPRY domain-containing protein n=1 Tax=Didymodactylos carnosus TaxID=1234261 RepID=A0A814TZ05_9BILA|nr:unnamed protein product [Didymodactylos carnosus]CAF1167704.1 unnamed protein product [Didymodactylos carnosus]CAF3857932.1 unnamed protein product [Didymodactylos carnosus]CAF3931330.1 unnamed protein product [Didymodactylos carnosus]
MEHRQQLSLEFDFIANEYNLLRSQQSLAFNINETDVLLNQIDTWEAETFQKVAMVADNARNKVRLLFHEIEEDMNHQLQKISIELRTAKDTEDYAEVKLEQWKNQLKELKEKLDQLHELILVDTTSNNQIECRNFLKVKIKYTRHAHIHESAEIQQSPQGINSAITQLRDGFKVITGNAHLEDLTVVHDKGDYSDIRGINLYESGEHHICFKFEQTQNKGVMLGIIASTFPTNKKSYHGGSSYAWCIGSKMCHLNGVWTDNNQHDINVDVNDELILIINCNQKKISLINERMNKHHEISVDIQSTPLPWQLRLNLLFPGDHVRICSQSTH